jgi:hypothetical protein
MSDTFNSNERYGDDLNNARRIDDDFLEMQSRGINRVWFLPIILFGGLLTTAIVLIANYFGGIYFSQNILTWVANWVIPVGAVLCGFLAGIGYAVAAYCVQFRPRKRFLLFIFLLQFLLFFVARYVEYTTVYHQVIQQRRQLFEQLIQNVDDKNDNLESNVKVIELENSEGKIVKVDRTKIDEAVKKTMPSFIDFYRNTIEETEWISDKNKDKPFKMGKWGWAIEFLTALVFALCSIICSVILMSVAYCQKCNLFMSKKLEFTFPLRAPKRKIKKNDEADIEAFRQEEIEAINYAIEKIDRIDNFLKAENSTNRAEVFKLLSDIRNEITTEAKPMKGVPNAVKVLYSECNSCNNFLIVASVTLLDVNDKSAFQAVELMRFADGNFIQPTVKIEIPSVQN